MKLGTHVDSGQMYRVYRNQAATAHLSLYSIFFLFSNIKIFRQTFLRRIFRHTFLSRVVGLGDEAG